MKPAQCSIDPCLLVITFGNTIIMTSSMSKEKLNEYVASADSKMAQYSSITQYGALELVP